MEALLAIAILVLFVMLFFSMSRTSQLRLEIERLKTALGAQGTELNRLLEMEEAWRRFAAATPAGAVGATPASKDVAAAPLAPAQDRARAAEQAVRQSFERRWGDYDAGKPLKEAVLEPLPDLVGEAAPPVALASAAVGVAQQRRQRQGPSAFEFWLAQVRTTEEWEALIGGRLLNRIGAVALILGVAFFFKYAVDQNWISQGMRVGIGVLAGAALLAVASRTHRHGYAIFAQGLVGAGLAVLYLSVYASFNFYHLVPQPVALAGMGLITALAFVQAVYYDSLAVSLLACAGGYATPFLLNASSSGPIGTIVYVFLLDMSTLAVLARKRSWVVLEPIAFGATYIIYFSWYLSSYSSDRMALAVVAITLFWALFLAFEVYDLMASGTAPELRHALGVANGLSYYGALFALIGPDHRAWMSLLTLAIGAIYLAVLLGLRRRQRLSRGLAVRYALAGIILLVTATAIGLRGLPVVMLWSLEALLLVWYGTRWRLWYIWGPALVVYVLAAGLLFATPGALAYEPIASFRPLLNERALAYIVLAAALAASTIPFRRLRRDRSRKFEQSLHYGWSGLIFILLAVETIDLFRHLMLNASAQTQIGLQLDRSLALALVWMAYSLPLVWFGLQKKIIPWIIAGLGSGAAGVGLAAVVGIAFEPIQRFTPAINVRAGAFILLLAGLALLLRWLTQKREALAWIDYARRAVQVVIALFGFELLSAEINDYFQHRFGHPLTSMGTVEAFIELSVLAAIWMLYALLPTWYGVRRRTMPLITTGLSMTAAATGVAAFAGIVLQPSHQLATPLGVRPFVLAIIVAGLAIELRWLGESQSALRWAGSAALALQAAIVLFGFGLISAETRDAFAQRIAGASGNTVTTLRDLERLAFSMVWLAYAILVMGLGIWRRARWMRLGAMALFAFIILKVFIYDLSFLGAVYRPISFAGLGVILLAVSFLYQRYRSILLLSSAPLPDEPQTPSAPAR